MRVNYTLPGLMPVDPAPVETPRAGDSPFRARLGIAPAPRWLDWRALLRLDEAPANAANIGPPPKPAAFEASDPQTTRVLWRQTLDRLVEGMGPDSQPQRPDTQAIERMLTLLLQFRDDEDEVTARHLAESEG